MKTSPRAVLAALISALFLVTLLAQPAAAHDRLKSSDPAKDAVVSGVDKVTLEFTATTSHQVVVVRGADGTTHQQGRPEADGTEVTQALKGTLPPGDYTIAFRVVSSDGHPIDGEIPFKVKGEPTPAASETPAAVTTQSARSAEPPAAAPASSQAVDTASSSTGTTFPVWLVIVIGGLVGIGIGLLFSMRNKKR
ncbi:copper resistance CopC family protein [Sinosporangium siamense]|nr:copper resistance CopC family protein [Sinosporangium siamense]